MPAADDQADAVLQRRLDTLSDEQRMLIVLKRELYEGNWDEMIADLHARLSGGPYIFKLATRIEDDLDRIEDLRAFEAAHGVDLSDFVRLDSE